MLLFALEKVPDRQNPLDCLPNEITDLLIMEPITVRQAWLACLSRVLQLIILCSSPVNSFTSNVTLDDEGFNHLIFSLRKLLLYTPLVLKLQNHPTFDISSPRCSLTLCWNPTQSSFFLNKKLSKDGMEQTMQSRWMMVDHQSHGGEAG